MVKSCFQRSNSNYKFETFEKRGREEKLTASALMEFVDTSAMVLMQWVAFSLPVFPMKNTQLSLKLFFNMTVRNVILMNWDKL